MQIQEEIHLSEGDHVVQFYDAETDLIGAVAGYLTAAVLDGNTVVVIATSSHRDAFRAALGAAALDVEALGEQGRLVVLDAADTLAKVMVAGRPSPAAFDAVVGELVRESAGAGAIRAYGEMVALLWDEGNVTAAIELERLWNELGARVPFSLFCAYPAHLVSAASDADAFDEICGLHSQVVAGAPLDETAEAWSRFAASVDAPRLARRFVADALGAWGLVDLVEDAMLVVSELAANAVNYAGGNFTVGLRRERGGVRVEVGDPGAAAPVVHEAGSWEPGGRGLHLVGALTRSWGHDFVAGGKIVWAELGGETSTAAAPSATPLAL